MSAAKMMRAPNVNEIAAKLARENPDLARSENREILWNKAHQQHTIEMRAFSARVVASVQQNPTTIVDTIRKQRAEVEAKRTMRAAPVLATTLRRKCDDYQRDGVPYDEAYRRAWEDATEEDRAWKHDHLQEISKILARDSGKAITLAAPPAPVAKVAPPPRYFAPGGASRAQVIEMAQAGALPVRTAPPLDNRMTRVQEHTRTLTARGIDYTQAYGEALAAIAAEDDALAERIEDRATHLMSLSKFVDFARFKDRDVAFATARAQVVSEDTLAGITTMKAGAK